MANYSSVRYGRGRSQRRGEARRPGQWKLAYADFLTALMAFFLLMWLSTEQSAENRTAIAAYFSGNSSTNAGQGVAPDADGSYTALMAKLTDAPGLSPFDGQIQLIERGEALRIEASDLTEAALFEMGQPDLTPAGRVLLAEIGRALLAEPFHVRIEGHTDAFPSHFEDMDNWQLSSRRANAARQALEAAGLAQDRIKAVTGLAATAPLLPNQPHAARNRRISIVLEQPG